MKYLLILLLLCQTASGQVKLQNVKIQNGKLAQLPVSGSSFAFDNQTRIIIPYGGAEMTFQQANDPIVIVNPRNTAQMLMLYDGLNSLGKSSAGVAWCFTNDPYTWTTNIFNPVFAANAAGSTYCRDDSFFYDAAIDKYVAFVSSTPDGDSVYRYTCDPGVSGMTLTNFANWVSDSGNPVFAPAGLEAHVSQFAWGKVSSSLYIGIYSYRTDTATLPGYRMVVSANGSNSWGGRWDIFAPDSGSFFEFHQLYITNNTAFLWAEIGLSAGLRWPTTLITCTNTPFTNALGWTREQIKLTDPFGWLGFQTISNWYEPTPSLAFIAGKPFMFMCQTGPQGANYNSLSYNLTTRPLTRTIPFFDSFIDLPDDERTNLFDDFHTNTLDYIYSTADGSATPAIANGGGNLLFHTSTNGWPWLFAQGANTTAWLFTNGICQSAQASFFGEQIFSQYRATNQETATALVGKGTVNGTLAEFGILLRGQANDASSTFKCYDLRYSDGNGFLIYRWDDKDTATQIGSTQPGILANNDTFKATVSGVGGTVTLTITTNNVQALQVTDTSGSRIILTGAVGLHSYNPGVFGQNYYFKSITSP